MSWKKPYIEIPEEFDGLEWMEMNFSQEGYDTLYDGPRPNGSSRTWYIEELGKIQMPLNMGYWNFFDETNNIFDAQGPLFDTHPTPYRSTPRTTKDARRSSVRESVHGQQIDGLQLRVARSDMPRACARMREMKPPRAL